jgi:hypothetical protein
MPGMREHFNGFGSVVAEVMHLPFFFLWRRLIHSKDLPFFLLRSLMPNAYYCETVSEQRAARCIVAPGGHDQRRWEAHPDTPPPVPRVEKHETPERD